MFQHFLIHYEIKRLKYLKIVKVDSYFRLRNLNTEVDPVFDDRGKN